jgi:transposase
MKRDGRGFDHRTLEAIRLMAVERVRGGERPSAVVASFGFHRTTIYKWLKVASKPGVGLKALHARPATGRPRSLTPRQEQQVFRWINGRDPRQYGLDFGLWTRSVVADLIERKFNIRLGVTAVGALLATDAAKTAATGLPTRSGSDRGMAARAVSCHCQTGKSLRR